MVTPPGRYVLGLLLLLWCASPAIAQEATGSVRGVVFDRDFDAPLPGCEVLVVETVAKVVTADQGNYLVPDVPAGTYTLVFSKQGYVRSVRADVVVEAGRLTEVDASLTGEFTEMEEFVVQDFLGGGAGTEAALLELRIESPALMDSISADLMSQAGASDAAAALTLVSGASVQDGKFAVVRGLPDRYVSSQMNGVRLPTADEDKRAVELDQFPSAVIESIQVTKTFTPDQQGDASGGAVDVRLKSIPDEGIFQLKLQGGWNQNVRGESDYLTFDRGPEKIQKGKLGENWRGDVGVEFDDAPHYDGKWSVSAGGKQDLDDDVTIGGFATFFYERDYSFFDDGRDDSYWIDVPGEGLVPQKIQNQGSDDFKTRLFDVTQSTDTTQFGGLGTFGIETERHKLYATFLHTTTEQDRATLAEDTRGKAYFFPGYDPDDPTGPGNTPNDITAAPYIRTETLEHTERTTSTFQLRGEHTLDTDGFDAIGLSFGAPEIDWAYAQSRATLDQPDKRQFGSLWLPASFNPGFPPFVPPFTTPPTHFPFKPAANFNLGNVQRIFKEIEEESDQYAVDLKLPFELDDEEGYVQFGLFSDEVDRSFDQDSYSNFGDAGATFEGPFEQFWSQAFPGEDHPITASDFDVDYEGELDVEAWYSMVDVPLGDRWNIVGGVRFEDTDISIVNDAEEQATWFPPDATAPVALGPGQADVDFEQDDVLPSIGLEFRPNEQVTLRTSYSQTVARQTFKELTPIIQQEFLGGPIFIGNPDLEMASLRNYDVRADYRPYEGALLSASWFKKDIKDPIEYVQRLAGFTFTTPVNYPEGELKGIELEARQQLGTWFESAEGLSVGANATFIDSEVKLPKRDKNDFKDPNIAQPISSRDMTGAPEHLYNVNLIYDLEQYGTQIALFYTIKGDTLVAGAGESNGNFVPDLYEKEFSQVNLSVTQALSEASTIQFKAKNLLDPDVETVYRPRRGKDVTNTSYKRGREFSLGLTVRF